MIGKRQREEQWSDLRRRMIDQQLRPLGIHDQRVLDGMDRLPREKFMPEAVRPLAYEDRAVAIGNDQTISQPFIVAYMTQHLAVSPGASVLEIGTGTGYQTALLAMLAGHVYSVERIEALQQRASRVLDSLGIRNITLITGDGTMGLPAHAPYERILVTASAPTVPTPLIAQLDEGGILVMPVGGRNEQTMVRVVKEDGRTVENPTLACRFVKLIGEAGWAADS